MAATFDLRRVMEDHVRHRPAVTLALRTSGDKRNVGFDFSSGQVTDMPARPGARSGRLPVYRSLLHGAGGVRPHPSPRDRFHHPRVSGLHPAGRLRGVLADDGLWMDMGTPEAYIQAHLDFPSPAPRIHPGAEVSSGASVDAASVTAPRHRGGGCRSGSASSGPAPACPQAPVRNGGFHLSL